MISEEAIHLEERIYEQLKKWREEKGWHFSLRKQLGKPTSARIFIGSVKGQYFGTTFWDMPGSASHVNDTINIFFSIRKRRGLTYSIDGRQSRKWDAPLTPVYLKLIEWLAAGTHEFADRAKINDTSRDVATVAIEGRQRGYNDFASYINDIEKDLELFIPLVDRKLQELSNAHPELSARRLTSSDTAEYEHRHRQLVERRNGKNQSDTMMQNEDAEYYVIGSKYGDNNAEDIYPEFRDRNVVAIGFAWNRDLTELYGNGPAKNREILKGEGEEPASYNALRKFIEIKPGDYIAVKRTGSPKGSTANLEIAAIGVAEERDGEFYRHEPEALAHTIPVRWIATDLDDTYELGYGMTVHRLSQEDHIEMIFSKYVDDLPTSASLVLTKKYPLNQILYGPPGTGKTYRTISLAVEIANPEFDSNAVTREEVRMEYARLQAAGRIVFTTFHQSLAYEDFVEGLKPRLDDVGGDEGQVDYEIKAGIFRRMSTQARASILRQRPTGTGKSVLDFDRKYELLAESVQNRLLEEGSVTLESRNGGVVYVHDISGHGNFRIKHQNGTRLYTVSKERLTKLHLELKDRGKVSNISETFRDIIGGSNASAHWAVLNAVRNTSPNGLKSSDNAGLGPVSMEALDTLTSEDYQRAGLPHHVLIIDEINRGNISRIFGELITLLEPDKRLGAQEALTVTLPYSGKDFGVPPNLYIIGTMNTADRSVVALDSALRRRFSFVEVGPEPELLRKVGNAGTIEVNGETFSLVAILQKINTRIEFLLDRDHCIGHSYFFTVKRWESLRGTMTKKVMPLLQEYFYDDYGRIRLILGYGFVKCDKVQPTDLFPGKDDLISELDEQVRYRLAKVQTEAELAEALRILLNGQGDE